MDAFDADVLIYAATDHPLGRPVRALLDPPDVRRTGSVLLVSELLTKPTRTGDARQVDALLAVLARLVLRPVDMATATLSVSLGAAYGLRAVDALHLATAVAAGASRFVTNNHRDFDAAAISEVEVVHPDQL